MVGKISLIDSGTTCPRHAETTTDKEEYHFENFIKISYGRYSCKAQGTSSL